MDHSEIEGEVYIKDLEGPALTKKEPPPPTTLKSILHYRKLVYLVAAPLVGLPLLLADYGTLEVRKAAYCSFWMAFYWVTEALPIAGTALFPLILFPLFGVVGAKAVAGAYFNDTIFLLTASFMFAYALEKWNLHTRLAMQVLLWMGGKPKLLLLGFMMTSAILSMWISNTATCAMMTPLCLAVIKEVEEKIKRDRKKPSTRTLSDVTLRMDDSLVGLDRSNESSSSESALVEPTVETHLVHAETHLKDMQLDQQQTDLDRYSIGLLLGIAYSCSVGGTGTLIGTGPNVVFVQQYTSLFPDAPEISFALWFVLMAPFALVMVFIMWGIIVLRYGRATTFKIEKSVIAAKKKAMGPLQFPHYVILIDFFLMALLWFTRGGFTPNTGWGQIFEKGFVTDATVCVCGVVVLFMIPDFKKRKNGDKLTFILDKSLFTSINWGVVMLLAGGMGLALGITTSGLSDYLATKFTAVSALPLFVLLMIVSLFTVLMTEFTSNVSTAIVFDPVLAALGVAIGQNPLLFLLSGTISSSFAFMFPVATPPNAIVFSSGKLKVLDMVVTGGILNAIGLVFVSLYLYLSAPLWGITLDQLPAWALSNVTATI